MPSYKVVKPGFYDGVYHDPEGKYNTLSVPKPFDPVPKWLTPIPEVKQSRAEKQLRAEKEQADLDKLAQDKIAVDAVRFDNPPSLSNAVETL
jgi:hypothetical protein